MKRKNTISKSKSSYLLKKGTVISKKALSLLFILLFLSLIILLMTGNKAHAAPELFASETLNGENFYSIDAANGSETWIGLHPGGC